MLMKRKQIVESTQFLQWMEAKHSLHQLKNQEWINDGILNFLKHITQFRNVWMRLVVLITANGQVQIFDPDTYFDFSIKYKIFSDMKYMNLPP